MTKRHHTNVGKWNSDMGPSHSVRRAIHEHAVAAKATAVVEYIFKCLPGRNIWHTSNETDRNWKTPLPPLPPLQPAAAHVHTITNSVGRPYFCSLPKPSPASSSYFAVLLAGNLHTPHQESFLHRCYSFWLIIIMADTFQPSIDHISHLKEDCNEFSTRPTASSSCTPRCFRLALASLDRKTPVSKLKMEHNAFQTPSPPSSCCTLHRLLRRQALSALDRNSPVNPASSSSPSSSAKHLHTPRTKSPSNKNQEKENQHKYNIPSPVQMISPPALERLKHDLINRRRPFDDSEEEEYYARRRANLSQMRGFREKARRLSKTIRKERRELDEGIQRFGEGSPEKIQNGVAGFGVFDSWRPLQVYPSWGDKGLPIRGGD